MLMSNGADPNHDNHRHLKCPMCHCCYKPEIITYKCVICNVKIPVKHSEDTHHDYKTCRFYGEDSEQCYKQK